jgi:hypothetical protein
LIKQEYRVFGPEVPTAVIMNNSVFWDITPCRPLKTNQRFGRSSRIYFQGQRISGASNQRENSWQEEALRVSCSVYSSTLKMEAKYASEKSA